MITRLEKFNPEEHAVWMEKAIEQGMKYNDNIPGAEKFLIEAQIEDTWVPVAILRVLENRDFLEPHANVFPWATKEIVLEGSREVIRTLTKTKNVLIVAGEGPNKLWDIMTKEGVVRFVGYLEHRDGRKQYLYQGVQ